MDEEQNQEGNHPKDEVCIYSMYKKENQTRKRKTSTHFSDQLQG